MASLRSPPRLPDAFGRLGHRVTLVLPRYRGVDFRERARSHDALMIGNHVQHVSFHAREERPGVTVVFVDVPELFDRAGGLYNVDGVDYPDNGWRFAVFSRAALEYARLRGRASIGDPRARLADRTGARLPEDAFLARSDRRRRACDLHDPQPRVSGCLSSFECCPAWDSVRRFSTFRRSSSGDRSAISRAASTSASA